MNVHLRVQHAPGRNGPLERLLASLGRPAVIVTDSVHPWSGYRKCLSDLPPDATHVAVLQDDTVAAPGLVDALPEVAAAHPDNVICLFLGGYPRRTAALAARAAQQGKRFCRVHPNDLLPVVATMWPRAKAEHLLAWAKENPLKLGHRDPKSDDAVTTRWMRLNHETAYCTVPSLVQHPDDVPSTIGRRARAGEDRNRVAAVWDPEFDAREVTWGDRTAVAVR